MDEAARRSNDKLLAMSPVHYGYCRHTMDFPVKALQVDGGAEFEAIFKEECQEKRMCHYSYERVHGLDFLSSIGYTTYDLELIYSSFGSQYEPDLVSLNAFFKNFQL